MYVIIGKLFFYILFVGHAVAFAGKSLPVTVRSNTTKQHDTQGKKQEDQTLSMDIADVPDAVYVGQRVPYTVCIVYDPQSIQLHQIIPPDIVHADIETSKEPHKERFYHDGRSYEKLTWHGVFYPRETGTVSLRGAKVQYVRLANDAKTSNRSVRYNLFGFFGPTHIKELYAAEKSCKVLPLPPYATAVSLIGELNTIEWTIASPADRPMEHGEACIGRLILYGQSNAAHITHEECLPLTSVPTGIKLYPAKKYPTEDGFVFEYTVQAVQEGSWTMPAYAVTFFDPRLKKYRVLRAQSHSIMVKPATQTQSVYDDRDLEPDTPETPVGSAVDEVVTNRFKNFIQELALPAWLVWLLAALALSILCIQLCWFWLYSYALILQKIISRRWLFFKLRRLVKHNLTTTRSMQAYILFQKLQHAINWKQVLHESPALYEAWLRCWQEILRIRFDKESVTVEQQFYSESVKVFSGLERGAWFL